MATADIIRKTQRSFGDDHEIFLSKADIVDFINEAIDELARSTKYKETSSTGAASTYATTGVAHNSAIFIHRVFYGTKPLALIDRESLDRLSTSQVVNQAEPVAYYFIGNTVHLFPRPLATDSTTITVYYSTIFTHLVDENSALPTDMPPVWENDIVNYCKAKANERNENYRAAEYYLKLWVEGLAQRSYEAVSRDDSFYTVGVDVMDTEDNYYYDSL